jgi:predicted RNase H-like nuclease
MRVTGVDGCRGGWVAVSLEATVSLEAGVSLDARVSLEATVPLEAAGSPVAVRVDASLAALLGPGPDRQPGPDRRPGPDRQDAMTVGIDMPLGLLETGWREADQAARGLLGPRRSSVFAIPPRAVWAEASYAAANRRCRELTGHGFSAQAWGLRAKLLEANQYRETCGHPLYEVHPELAFAALARQPLAASKHTAAGRDLRRELLAGAGIEIPPLTPAALIADVLDAAAVAWSAQRIAAGLAVTIPAEPQHDRQGRHIAIRY